jgi:hypothetical protein
MNVTLDPWRKETVKGLIENAGHIFTWYKWASAGTGNPAYGQGKIQYYVTGEMTGIWGQPGTVGFQPMAGGQVVEGGQVVFSLSKPTTADKLAYSGRTFEVIADPWMANINGVMYWRIEVKVG